MRGVRRAVRPGSATFSGVTVPCPTCRRANAPHRETCLYCGARMPTPTAKPPPKERVLPANFDELVRHAMTGAGGVQQLKKALQATPPPEAEAEAPAAPVEAAPAAEAGPPALPSPAPVAAAAISAAVAGPAEAASAVVPPAAVSPRPPSPDPLGELLAAAQRAHALRDDPSALPVVLREVEEALVAARATLPTAAPAAVGPESPEAGIRLAAARHPFALVLGAVPAGIETARLATALGVDPATARAAILAGGTRIALRGTDRDLLERRAVHLRAEGLEATVVARTELTVWGPAKGLVGVEGPMAWRIVEASRWGEERPDPSQLPRGTVAAVGAVWLVVPGDVEEKRLRAPAAESRWQRGHFAAPNGAGGEARLAVVDVYTDAGLLRLVEGGFDPRGLGDGSSSQRLAVKAFLDTLGSRWPDSRVEARRTILSAPRPGDTLRADGWAGWEEHSRACAALLGLPIPG